jgi:tellurite resistance protein
MSSTNRTSVGTAATAAKNTGFSGWAPPISLFSIPLGLAGLGSGWTAAAQLLGASDVPGDIAYAASAIVWAVFTLIYVVSTIRQESGSFHVDLRHPLAGPLTAYIPMIALLLVAHYATSLGDAARWLCYAAVAALATNAQRWSRTG